MDEEFAPNRQRLFNGFFLLEDYFEVSQCLEEEQTILLNLTKAVQKEILTYEHQERIRPTIKSSNNRRIFGKTSTPPPRPPPHKRVVTMFESEKEVFLIHGKSQNFQSLLLKAGRVDKIKLKSKKFGFIYHTEGDVGNRIFHVRRYEIPDEMDDNNLIKVSCIGEQTKVSLIIEEGPNGEEKELEEIESKAYYERDRTGGKTLSDYLSSGGTIMNVISSTYKIVASFIGLK